MSATPWTPKSQASPSPSASTPKKRLRPTGDEVLAGPGLPVLDAAGRAMLEEDLRSPCTEEIAVFRAFARTVDQGEDRFVVLDTAPTGHTILLLDAAEAYHREVMRTQTDMPQAVRALLPRLRDRDFTKAIIVTLPEATPVHEAERLQEDLARAGITPFAWVINQKFSLQRDGRSFPHRTRPVRAPLHRAGCPCFGTTHGVNPLDGVRIAPRPATCASPKSLLHAGTVRGKAAKLRVSITAVHHEK